MSVDGNWNITVNSPMGAQPSSLSLKADGGTLTGTQSAQGNTADIANGKVDGDTLNGNVKAGAFGSFPFTGSRA